MTNDAPELRAPLASDTLLLIRGGVPYQIALADLARMLPTLTAKETPASGDLAVIYDAVSREARAVDVGSLAPTSPLTTLGDTLYAAAQGVQTRLAGNITATKKLLTQTGTGSVSAAPAWDTLSYGDVGAAASGHNHDTAYEPLVVNTLGDLLYGGANGAATRLPGNVESGKKVLNQQGTGTASAAPFWAALSAADVGAVSAVNPATNIPAPTSGETVDAQARSAIGSILALLIATGMMAGES